MEEQYTSAYPIIPANRANDPQYHVPPYDATIQLEPNFFCRARNTKREKYCRSRSGHGTDHVGQGRCKFHGGSVPIVTGRYSEIVRGSLGEHLDRLELEEEREKLDIIPEATLLRGITLDVAERFQSFMDAVINWNEAESIDASAEKRRPKLIRVPDLGQLADLAKKSADIIHNVHKQRSANAISLADFYRLMGAMAESVATQTAKHFKRYVEAGVVPQSVVDNYTTAVQEEWRAIKLKA